MYIDHPKIGRSKNLASVCVRERCCRSCPCRRDHVNQKHRIESRWQWNDRAYMSLPKDVACVPSSLKPYRKLGGMLSRSYSSSPHCVHSIFMSLARNASIILSVGATAARPRLARGESWGSRKKSPTYQYISDILNATPGSILCISMMTKPVFAGSIMMGDFSFLPPRFKVTGFAALPRVRSHPMLVLSQ